MNLNDEAPKALGPQTPLIGDDKSLLRIGLSLGGVIALWKFWVVMTANPIWEEAHFAVSGTHLALGYPDIPAGFVWLSRPVTQWFGWHLLPLRLLALIISMGVAPAVWFMVRPLMRPRLSLWAAILALILPPLSVSGTIYYPEGLLQVLTALMLGCLIRALKSEPDTVAGSGLIPENWKWWLWTGLAGAAGLFVHYRFLGVGAGIIAYALATTEGRALWKRPQFWAAGTIAALGLVPSLIYNATHDWPAIAFHLKNRPDWRPNNGLMLSFLSQQIGLVTPVFFIIMMGRVWKTLGPIPEGAEAPDLRLKLLAWVALVIFGIYFLQAPANHMLYPHWPFMAYVAGVAFLPSAMIDWADGATAPVKRLGIALLIGLGPVMAVGIGIGLSIYEYAFAHAAEIPANWRVLNVMKNEDYRLARPQIEAALTPDGTGAKPVLVASGHVLALRLEFPTDVSHRIYTLGEPDDVRTRFGTARHDWRLGLEDLARDQSGRSALIVFQDPTYLYHTQDETAFRVEACRHFDEIVPAGQITLPPGKVVLALYRGRVRSNPASGKAPCAFLPSLYLAQPKRAVFIRPQKENYFGIAADPKGVRRLEILIDGTPVTEARLHLDLPNYHAPSLFSYDPDYPRVQFDFNLRDINIQKGQHLISLRATLGDGTVKTGAERVIYK